MNKPYILSVLLVLLFSLILIGNTVAAVYCNQIKGCKGLAGCLTFASVKGCELTCIDGTKVTCLQDGGGGGGDGDGPPGPVE